MILATLIPILVCACAGTGLHSMLTGNYREMNLDELCRAHSYGLAGDRAVAEMRFRGSFGAQDLERIREKRIEVGMGERAFLCITRDQTLSGAPPRPVDSSYGTQTYELAGYDYEKTLVEIRDGIVVRVSQTR